MPAAVLAAVLLFVPPGLAQEAAPTGGIAILNQERLISQTLYGQRIQRELELASNALAAENRRIEGQLSEEELRLTELRDTLQAEEFRALADDFDSRVEGIRAAQDAKARDLQDQTEIAQARFFELTLPILLDLVRARGAAVLMDSRAVLLSADSVDITEAAITRIDAELGEGGARPLISLDGAASADAPDDDPGADPDAPPPPIPPQTEP
ncbi:Outer membrane protein H precursor [Roseibacterium elongatum DSM 19469]|uniref:Outer membrane protein H n=2 Tax=Roseicyclus elongatus TaxID=159346 RepID=W8RUX6_9RHOB|nr:Outer membrane protein H precursor [Roseibacterium elongatum DSM 19469]